MSLTMLLYGAAAGAGPVLVSTAALWARTRRLARDLATIHTDLQAARYEADHDGLTGLPNRGAFYGHGAAMLANAGGPLVVVVLDVDDFKAVNDTYGHANGDLVLRVVGDRLRERVAGDGIVARLGGDEFAAVVRLRDGESARDLGEALADVTDAPIDLDDVANLSLTVSAGVAPVPVTGRQVGLGELLGRADAAMYRSKHTTGSTAVYAPQLDDHTAPLPEVRPVLRTRELGNTALVGRSGLGVAA